MVFSLGVHPERVSDRSKNFTNYRKRGNCKMKLCTKFECNEAIRSGVSAISVFDLMTLNIVLRVALGSRIIFTKFDIRQLVRA